MSDSTPRRPGRLMWLGLGLTSALLLMAFLLASLKPHNNLEKPLLDIGPVADFVLTNQDGRVISLNDLRGHVWIADIIFTRCAGPCPRMTRQMKELQDALPAGSPTRLVTLTTDPTYDTPTILKVCAQKAAADPARWFFLTGTPKQISDLAIDSLKFTALEKKPQERESPVDLFIHSTRFVVVDKQAHLRGLFDTGGEGIEPGAVKSDILNAVKRLEREP